MADWLDEAEKKANRGERKGSSSERIQIKKDRIAENYQKNQQKYDGLIASLLELVDRVNALPENFRKEFGKIEGKRKSSKLNNHLFILSSSRRIEGSSGRGFLSFFFPKHVKHIRVIFFSVSKYPDKCDIEIKESFLERKRMRHDASNASPQKDHIGQHVLLNVFFDEIPAETTRRIIDYMAFKCKISELQLPIQQKPKM